MFLDSCLWNRRGRAGCGKLVEIFRVEVSRRSLTLLRIWARTSAPRMAHQRQYIRFLSAKLLPITYTYSVSIVYVAKRAGTTTLFLLGS
jgi:hypothetical protein